MSKYHIYTDGACSGNPGRGGLAAVAFNEEGNKIFQISGGFRKTTNNRMEILAVIWALKKVIADNDVPPEIEIHSDSQLVIGTMNQGWNKKSNVDLWTELESILDCFKTKCVPVGFVKVKGHDKDAGNNLADSIAVAASSEFNANLIDTEFEKKENEMKKTVEETLVSFDKVEIANYTFFGENTPSDRHIEVMLTNGTVVTISPCHGGFQQYGCTQAESKITVNLAFKYQGWLNGSKK